MLKGPFLERKWMSSVSNFPEADIILLGVPYDCTCSYRPGARFAPEEIRIASWGLENYSPYLDKVLDDVNFFDAGDLELPFSATNKALDIIQNNVAEILFNNKKYLGVGGEHLVTLPAIKACQEKYNDLAVIHFDAHSDLRNNYLGEKLSHSTVMKRVSEIVGIENIIQVGIRSGLKEEFDLMRNNQTLITSPWELEKFKTRNIFLTIDLDILDPSIFPGTGTPEAGGFTFSELMEWFKHLQNYNIVSADVVELSPHYDATGVSTCVAAKVIRELLMLL